MDSMQLKSFPHSYTVHKKKVLFHTFIEKDHLGDCSPEKDCL